LHPQHFEGKFIDNEKAVFTAPQVNMLFSRDLPLRQEPQKNHVYFGGYDLAHKQDATAGYVLDCTKKPFEIVYSYYGKFVPWPVIKDEIRRTFNYYKPEQPFLIDATGPGDPIFADLEDICDPFIFTARSKYDLILNFQKALDYNRRVDSDMVDIEDDFGLIRSPEDLQLKDELLAYRHEDKKLDTDTVMALALALYQAWEGEDIQTGEVSRWEF
jgi:hypothetical protein